MPTSIRATRKPTSAEPANAKSANAKRAKGSVPSSAACVALFSIASLAASSVTAQDAPDDRPSIEVTLQPGCADLDEAVVRRVLEVELGDYAQLRDDAELGGEAPDAQVVLACATPIFALTLTEHGTDRRLSRELEIDTASGRSRLVALAISELIAASWIVTERARPAVEIPVTEPIAAAPVPEGPTEERLITPDTSDLEPNAAGVRIFGVAQISGEPFHFSGGGGAGFDTLLIEPVALAIDARVTRGTIDADAGSVDLTALTLGAFLALRAPFDRNHADIGVGVRGGAGLLEGHGSEGIGGQLVVGPIIAFAATTLLSLHLLGTAYAHVGIELGYTIAGVAGTLATTGERLARLGGAYISVSVGFEVRPGR